MKRKKVQYYITLYTQKLNCACKFFFQNCLFEYKYQFAVEKTQKDILGQIRNTQKVFCCRHQKMLVTDLVYFFIDLVY